MHIFEKQRLRNFACFFKNALFRELFRKHRKVPRAPAGDDRIRPHSGQIKSYHCQQHPSCQAEFGCRARIHRHKDRVIKGTASIPFSSRSVTKNPTSFRHQLRAFLGPILSFPLSQTALGVCAPTVPPCANRTSLSANDHNKKHQTGFGSGPGSRIGAFSTSSEARAVAVGSE